MAQFFAKLVLAASSIGMAVLMCEFILGAVSPQQRSIWDNTRDGVTVHRRNLESYLPRFDLTVRTNSFGMRDRERSVEKPNGTFRILLLGDSFMEALQVPFDESFPALIEADLRERTGRAIEVVNASVSGWGTDDELTYLTRYGLAFQPDLVLVGVTLHNDVNDNLVMEFHDFRDGTLVERPRTEMPLRVYALQKFKSWIAATSHLYQVAYLTAISKQVEAGANQLRSHLSDLIRRDPSPRVEAGWQMTTQLLTKLRERAAEADSATAVFLIPLAIQIYDVEYRDFLARHKLLPVEVDRVGPQKQLMEWSSRAGVPLVDLMERFRDRFAQTGRTLHLAEDGHWTAEGHEVAASFVADALVEQGVIADR